MRSLVATLSRWVSTIIKRWKPYFSPLFLRTLWLRTQRGSNRGRVRIAGWNINHVDAPSLGVMLDTLVIRRWNDFIPDTDQPVILDCGANIGIGVLHYKRQFPQARIIAFEPDPIIFNTLQENISQNQLDQVEAVEAAVWINDGTTTFYQEGTHAGTLFGETSEGLNKITVKTVDLADYLVDPIDLLKVDIEGAELEVIPHVADQLHLVKNLIVECHLKCDQMAELTRLLEVLVQSGFQFSVNSIGQWIDLLQKPQPTPELHYDQTLLITAWRGS